MQQEISEACMLLTTTRDIWKIVRQTYSEARDAAHIYEIKTEIDATKQGSPEVVVGKGQLQWIIKFYLVAKLKALKSKLKEWNRDVFAKVEVRKTLALNQMDYWDAKKKTSTLSLEELEVRKEAREDYKKWVLLEENLGGKNLEKCGRKKETEISDSFTR
ncbi:hypothetical protein CK203_048469 [Vitis vinifera]|uniref:Uncharacterized protein n=1 Tax=Vitis vinifera TaxID=29760 RepID=A0A438H2V5_VITVI|nr:hypothetical protein CK203_048469 [Vitis vinifera]